MIFMQIEIILLLLTTWLFAPEIAARIVKYYRAVIAWRDCVDSDMIASEMTFRPETPKKRVY